MENIKVSIIIPVLNTQNYIRECLESAVNQTLKEIEIVCVDAYSTDGTREIIKEYAQRDRRVRLLNDDRGSTGYANNLGFREAAGKYVAILEPDDYVSPVMYEKLYLMAEMENCDTVRADYQVFWGEGEERLFLDKPVAKEKCIYNQVLSAKKDKSLFLNDMSTWTGIYKKDCLEKYHIRHNETPGASYQDNGFWFQVMALADRVIYVPVSGYRYRLDNPVSSVNNPQKLFAICDEFDFIQKKLAKENNFTPNKEIFSYMKYIRYVGSYYRLAPELQLQFAERFCQEMREHKEKGEINWSMFSQTQKEMLEKIISSPYEFMNHIEQGQRKVMNFLDKQGQVIQFGCGSDGIRFLSYMKLHGMTDKIVCIADNNPKLQEKSLFGIPLVSPEYARQQYPHFGYVITSLNYGESIREQLEQSGVEKDKMIISCLC